MSKDDKSLAINGGNPLSKENILIHKPYLDDQDLQAVLESVKSTFVSGDGPACREFEKKLANYLDVKHVFFVNSCTAALELAFRAKNFPQGSEVIVPNFTYTSSALGALYNNLKIKLVDVYSYNGNIDVSKIEAVITDKTVAIVPVDYAGNPADMDPVKKIAQKHGLYVVHDTAQSIGATYKGQKTGTLAEISTFSFHGTKNITTGEGGSIVTDSDELAEKIIFMREKGTNKHSFLTDNITRGYYEYVSIGASYVQSNILGALGVTQIDKLDWITKKRAEIAEYYMQELGDVPGIQLPKPTKDSQSNWHIFYILIPPEEKYWILDAMRAEGVYVNVHYTPLHRNKYYAHLGEDQDFPNSMKYFSRLLRLPIYPGLTDSEIERVPLALKKVMQAL